MEKSIVMEFKLYGLANEDFIKMGKVVSLKPRTIHPPLLGF